MNTYKIIILIMLFSMIACNNGNNNGSNSTSQSVKEIEQIKPILDQFNSQHYNESFKGFQQVAETGNSEAEFYLAYSYINGLGVKRDLKEGVKWLNKSSDQGNDKGMCLLGAQYLNGEGVDKDIQQAVRLLTEAGKKENVTALHTLGLLNIQGKVIPKNAEKAIEYYKKAAEKDFVPSQYSLGMLYLEEKETPRNEEEAVKYLQLAARTGDKDANLQYGKAIIMLLTKKIENKPSNELYAQRGLVTYSIGMYDFARKDFYIACYGDHNNLERQEAESLGCKAYMSMRLGMNIDALAQKYKSTIPNM